MRSLGPLNEGDIHRLFLQYQYPTLYTSQVNGGACLCPRFFFHLTDRKHHLSHFSKRVEDRCESLLSSCRERFSMPPSTLTPETELVKVAVLIIPTLGVRDPLPVVDIELIRCMCGAEREIGNPSLSVLFERVLHSKTRMATSITSATRPATTPPIKAAWGDLCCSTSSTDCSSSESSESLRNSSIA